MHEFSGSLLAEEHDRLECEAGVSVFRVVGGPVCHLVSVFAGGYRANASASTL